MFQGRIQFTETGKVDWFSKVRNSFVTSADSHSAIRVPDSELEKIEGKHLVELSQFVKQGKLPKVLTETDGQNNYVLLEDKVHRVCAPTEDSNRSYSFIFWTKDDAEDKDPALKKVVRQLCSHTLCSA